MNGHNHSNVSVRLLFEFDIEPALFLADLGLTMFTVLTAHLSGRVGGTGQCQLVAVFKSETKLLGVIASLNLVVVDIIAVHCALIALEGGH